MTNFDPVQTFDGLPHKYCSIGLLTNGELANSTGRRSTVKVDDLIITMIGGPACAVILSPYTIFMQITSQASAGIAQHVLASLGGSGPNQWSKYTFICLLRT